MQVWLLWRILCSLTPEQIPESWRNLNFEEFELVVETPTRDFIIDPNQTAFIERVHSAYAWIYDLSSGEHPGIFREAQENRQCTPDEPHPYCSLPFRCCFVRNLPFPRARQQLKRALWTWYRSLLWERIWGDLWYYQLTMLNFDELVNQGLLVQSRILEFDGNKLQIEVEGNIRGQLRGYESCIVILFGTVFCGIHCSARFMEIEENVVNLEITDPLMRLLLRLEDRYHDILIVPQNTQSALLKDRPLSFLHKHTQRALFRLEKMGAQKEEKAQRRSEIQLIEAIFGSKRLVRERPDEIQRD